jgi:hypothetical protein
MIAMSAIRMRAACVSVAALVALIRDAAAQQPKTALMAMKQQTGK